MNREERFTAFIDYFSIHYPHAETELNYRTPYELLVAVILSAQCTDKRVNLITPDLFKRFPTEKALSEGSVEEIFSLIRSCSYPNNKAKNLSAMSKMLHGEFKGVIPRELDLITKLPGVGRKTANVILSVVYDVPAIAVDTHVFRVSQRLGLVEEGKSVLETEKTLMRYIPREKWGVAHHWLILHGRYVCLARKPKCDICEITHFCKYYAEHDGDIQ